MTALALLVAYVLVTLGIVNMVAGQVATGAGLFAVGCAVAASTRLLK